ncbi:hypothetical protein [Novosphingobium olei]|uniref:hypothetical protein n=1 Tax=Novosphingobium olei TaxID=2728851 RepID=UPI00308FD16F|nr:hypothetical protein NSDW_33260 [Novosphingobium olei]
MVSMDLGGMLAALIFGFCLGFLFGCTWHAHFAMVTRREAEAAAMAEGDRP